MEHVIAGRAVAFAEAATEDFQLYQKQVLHNAQALAAGLANEGFRLVSGGTDNHMLLVDLGQDEASITGKDAEHRLDAINITVNKNTVPRETRSPFVTSGLRMGSPAVTSRGLKEEDMTTIASFIGQALKQPLTEKETEQLASQVAQFIGKFPTP